MPCSQALILGRKGLAGPGGAGANRHRSLLWDAAGVAVGVTAGGDVDGGFGQGEQLLLGAGGVSGSWAIEGAASRGAGAGGGASLRRKRAAGGSAPQRRRLQR